ncbi:MAG: hypothetical protein AAGH74_04595 [Pseudomonadota bacterium]
MTQIVKAKKFIAAAPKEAMTDVLGLVGLCVMIFAGFAAPAFF